MDAGWILTRDFAGNISSNDEDFIFGKKKRTGTGSGTGTGKKPIRHVKETMDYSKANYNALELNVSDQPQTELTIGGTALSLSLTGGAAQAVCRRADDVADEGGRDEDRAQRARAHRGDGCAGQRLAFRRRNL